MKSYNDLYKRSFVKFAETALNDCTSFREMGQYAKLLHGWAEQLLKRASRNSEIAHSDLERDIYEEGRGYIRKFSNKFKAKIH